MQIREEVPGDRDEIVVLLDRAFGGTEESVLVADLRAEDAVIAALIATGNGRILGHILFSELPIEGDGGVLRAAALAPLAVLPERQGQGIGTALARAGLAACRPPSCSAILRIIRVSGSPRRQRRNCARRSADRPSWQWSWYPAASMA